MAEMTETGAAVELVNLAGGQIGRYTFQPGWRRSEFQGAANYAKG